MMSDQPVGPSNFHRLRQIPVPANRVTDAAGLRRRLLYDYRVLQPSEITDPNDNKSRFFLALGSE
jgi:hypothetical protein